MSKMDRRRFLQTAGGLGVLLFGNLLGCNLPERKRTSFKWDFHPSQSWKDAIEEGYESRGRVLLKGKAFLYNRIVDSGSLAFKEIRKPGEELWQVDLYQNSFYCPEIFQELGKRLPRLSELMQKDIDWTDKVKIRDLKQDGRIIGAEFYYLNGKSEEYRFE